jgi:hypothetical protein
MSKDSLLDFAFGLQRVRFFSFSEFIFWVNFLMFWKEKDFRILSIENEIPWRVAGSSPLSGTQTLKSVNLQLHAEY